MDDLSNSFMKFRSGLISLVRRFVDNHVDIEDIVQEAYALSLEASKSRAIKSPKAFIATTARNLAINHINSAAVRLNEPISDKAFAGLCTETSLDEEMELDRKFRIYCQAVEALPTRCRRVFTLKQVYGLTQREIAEQLGISEKTVEYHVSKGLLHCRRYISAQSKARGEAPLNSGHRSSVGGAEP